MKYKKTALVIATIVVMITLAGCAPQANQVGAFIPVPPISSLIAGFLQAAFILWVLIWNLLSYLFPLGHFDAYQDGAGSWYDIGFAIGLFFAVGISFFGYRRVNNFSRSRRE